LKQETGELQDLIERWRENEEDQGSVLEAWRDAFDMTMTDDGKWTWQPLWGDHNALVNAYNELVRRWNKYLPIINQSTSQTVGRPLAASEVQVATVRKLRKQGVSLRDIVVETGLGLGTVRTIVGQMVGTDRTAQKHRKRLGLEPIKIDKATRARWQRSKRTGDALPKRAQQVHEARQALLMEAKCLGKAR
jgi:hypothetical protein